MHRRVLLFSLMTLLAIGGLFAPHAAEAAANEIIYTDNTATNFDGSWERVDDGCGAPVGGGGNEYHVESFTVSITGSYDIYSVQDYWTDNFNGSIVLYENSFDPNNPLTNCIDANDDSDFFENGFNHSSILQNITLSAGTTYHLVTTGYDNTESGRFFNRIAGPGTITLGSNTPLTRPIAFPYSDCGFAVDLDAPFVELLNDTWGFENVNQDGSIEDAADFAYLTTNNGLDDAYDDMFCLDVDGIAFPQEYPLGTDTPFTTELGGRQYVFGPVPMSELNVTRKLYLSNGDVDWFRYLEIFENPTSNAITVTVRIYGELGSDDSTIVEDSSDGDAVWPEFTDRWLVTSDQPTDGENADGDPILTYNYFGPQAPLPIFNAGGFVDGTTLLGESVDLSDDEMFYEFNLTIPANSKRIIMHFGGFNETVSGASALAASLDQLLNDFPADVLVGLTDEEIQQEIVNWYYVPSLVLSKTFEPSSVPVSSSSKAVFSLDNLTGTSSVTNVQVRDEFPAGLLVASLSGASPNAVGLTSSANCTVSANPDMVLNGGIVDFTVASVPAGEICEVYVNVWSQAVGEYCNTADLVTIFSSDQSGDIEPDFVQACVSFTAGVAGGVSVFDPAISKVGVLQPGETGVTGEALEWIVTVSNSSGVTGNNVVVSDTIDSRMTVDNVVAPGGTVSISGQTVTVTYPNLFPGQSVNFSVFTTVLDGLFISNTACVNAANQGATECATADALGTALPESLPQTGESPYSVLRLPLAILLGLVGLMVVRRKLSWTR